MRLAPLVLALLSWPLACRCDEPECGDDTRDPGELCFEDTRPRLTVDQDTPYALRVGRFNSDDLLDLLVVGVNDDILRADLLRGEKDGGFAEARPVTISGSTAYPISGDLDADGRDDLVFAMSLQTVVAYFAQQDGSFAAPLVLPVLVELRQVAVVDVDGDGRRDILALGVDAATRAPALSFLQSTPAGFAPAFSTPLPVAGIADFAPVAMLAARRDRDDGFEVLLTEPNRRNAVARTRYAGAATFAPAERLDLDIELAGLALRDLDGDDTLDLLAGDRDRGEVATYFTVDGQLAPGPRTDLETDEWQSLTLAHLDDDGWLDLAVADGAHVSLWRGAGDGGFARGADLDFAADVVELVLHDLNDDGRADLIAGTFAADDPITIVLSGP
jgi:hypothetical protein